MDGLALTPGALAEMIALIEDGTISGKIGKDVLPRLLEGEGNAGVRAFVEKQGLVQISGAPACWFVLLGGACMHAWRLDIGGRLALQLTRPETTSAFLALP